MSDSTKEPKGKEVLEEDSKEEEESVEEIFEEKFRYLITLSETILRISGALNIRSKKKDIFDVGSDKITEEIDKNESYLKKYKILYDKTTPEDHMCYFRDLYTSKKKIILRGYLADSWLDDEKCEIIFGVEVEGGRSKGYIIPIGWIYKKIKSIKDDPENEQKIITKMESFSFQLRHTLYVIFSLFEEDDAKLKKLQKSIVKLEKEISSKTEKPGNSNNNGFMNKLFDKIPDIVSAVGSQFAGAGAGADGQTPPDMNAMSDMMQNMFKNNEMGGKMQEMMAKMSGGGGDINFQEMLGSMMSGMKNMPGMTQTAGDGAEAGPSSSGVAAIEGGGECECELPQVNTSKE